MLLLKILQMIYKIYIGRITLKSHTHELSVVNVKLSLTKAHGLCYRSLPYIHDHEQQAALVTTTNETATAPKTACYFGTGCCGPVIHWNKNSFDLFFTVKYLKI